MFITIDGAEQKLALSAKSDDKYAPRNTGVYDVWLKAYDGP
jgi:hypothetical protein